MNKGMSPNELKAAQKMAVTAGLEVVGVGPSPWRGPNYKATAFIVRNPATRRPNRWVSFEDYSVGVTAFMAAKNRPKRAVKA